MLFAKCLQVISLDVPNARANILCQIELAVRTYYSCKYRQKLPVQQVKFPLTLTEIEG